MATQYSNKPIVTNGLVYALDFGNQKSYVSGSSSARSLRFFPTTSSFAYYGGLSTIPNLVNGLLQLSGSGTTTGSQLVTNTQFSDLVPAGDFTIQVVVNNKGEGIFITQGPSDTRLISTLNTSGTVLGWYINPLPYAQAGGSGGNYYNKSYPLSSRLQHLTYRYSSGSYDLFVNGIPVSPSGRYSNITTNSGNLTINGAQSNGFSNTDLGNFYIYDRALTSDEIYSNYLIQAQRYGLPTIPKPYTIDENAYLFLSQSGITDPIITSSIDTFVRGLKSASLWDKMIAIYPFVGTGSVGVNLTGSQSWNLKEPTSAFYRLAFTGSWNGSTSGSTPSGSNTSINTGVLPYEYYPFKSDSNQHISILSYDTPTSSSFLAGTGIDIETAVSTLAGDYGTPAAAYSVRKVRTAYSGALMDVRRSIDNVTSSIGYVSNGDLDTGSLLDWVVPGRNTLPGAYSGLAAAYSLRRVSGSYTGSAVRVRGDIENQFRDIGFDASGNLDTGSLLNFTATGSNTLAGSYSGLVAAYSVRRVVPGYSGNLIEVRSGSVSQSIGIDSSGNLDTGSLLTFAGSGDAFVKTWYDQSGNTNHVSNTSSLEQPQIVSGGVLITLNNKPAIDHTRSQVLKLPSDINLSTTYGLFAVVDFDVYGAEVFGSLTSPFSYGIYQDATNNYHAPSAVYASSNGVFGLDRALLSIIRDGTTSVTQYKNSTVLGSTMTLSSNADFKFGTLSGESPTYNLDGKLSEILIYSSSQSTTRTRIENNINAYYDIYTTSSVSTENAFVNTWYDQSGNNRHATQTTSSRQPLIVSSGSLVTSSAKPAVKFNGTSTNLKTNTFSTVSSSLTTFTAVKFDSFTSYNFVFSHGNENIILGVTNPGSGLKFWARNNNSLYSGDTVQTNTPYLVYVLYNTGSSEIASNGSTLVTGSLGATNSWSTITIGSDTDDEGGTFINGTVSEHLEYYANQSSSRSLIENNINNYYSIYTGSNNGFVARWYDQSGNNRHASQTATGSQPIIVESGSIYTLSGKPAISSSQKRLNLASTATFTDFSFFTVTKKANSTNSQAVLFSSNTFGDGGGDNNDNEGTPVIGNLGSYIIAKSLGNSFNFDGTAHHLSYYQRVGSTAVGGYNGLVTGSASGISTANVQINSILAYPPTPGYFYVGLAQELIFYSNSLASSRQAIEYGINNYYNIYPQTSSFTTSSFTIKATPTGITGAINNQPLNGISSTGPVGFITVSRTGSNALTIARNGVTSSFTVPASGALSTGIYLGASNYNGITVGSSPLGISFASVGVGLNNSELLTYKNLVNTLQTSLGRVDLDALSFISSTQTLNITQQNAINTLVLDLKRFGLWDKMKAIYPFVGGTADTHKFNLKDPRDLDAAYRLTFSGTWTHNSSGSQPTDSRANSYIVPTADLERDSVHLSIYSQTSNVTSGADWSAQPNTFYFGPLLAASLYATLNNGEVNTGNTPYNSARGLLIATRVNSNTINFYYNTNLLRTSTVSSAVGSSTQTLLLGGFPDGRYNSNKMWSFGTVGSGLSTVDINNLYTAVQRFQTALGRQV